MPEPNLNSTPPSSPTTPPAPGSVTQPNVTSPLVPGAVPGRPAGPVVTPPAQPPVAVSTSAPLPGPMRPDLPEPPSGLRARLAVVILVMLVLVAGGVALYQFGPFKPVARLPKPTATPIITSDIQSEVTDVNAALRAADANLSGLTAGLADQPGSLSE
ncbi:MAG TPA: hypothetical protein VLI05_06685 [Candidatus Saccharimonadia bacterium]|nr:hypothetical protein [Candidatus Saccharimonadia bacterium]